LLYLQDMSVDVLKSVLVGICLAAPIGPVLLTVMQKTLSYGKGTGTKAALGCAVMDTVYATLSFIALAFIKGFLEEHKLLVAIIGGCVVIALGVMMMLSDPYSKYRERTASGWAAFWEVALIILTNPGSILYDFTVCTFFGLEARGWDLVPLSLGVFAGEALFWTLIILLFGHLHHRLGKETIVKLSKLSGAVLLVCGIVIMVKGFI